MEDMDHCTAAESVERERSWYLWFHVDVGSHDDDIET